MLPEHGRVASLLIFQLQQDFPNPLQEYRRPEFFFYLTIAPEILTLFFGQARSLALAFNKLKCLFITKRLQGNLLKNIRKKARHVRPFCQYHHRRKERIQWLFGDDNKREK